MDRTRSAIGITLSFVVIAGSLIVGWKLSSLGEQRALETLSASGMGDPQGLSESISTTLYGYAIGLFGTFIGLIILVVCLVFYVRAGRRLRGLEARAKGGTAASGN